MFSGIINHVGQVLSLSSSPQALRIEITTEFPQLVLGESIAVDGVCLTLASKGERSFEVDVSPETLKLTHLAFLQPAQLLNLERSLTLNDLLGGHIVMGHVDQLAEVKNIQLRGQAKEIEIAGIKEEFKPYLIPKGSICLNGVSLTLNELTADGFKLMIIPHTLAVTNLNTLKPGSKVNLEFDILAKTIFRQLSFIQKTSL